MKPAVLRPQALRDQQGEVRYYRREGGARVAVRMVEATNVALDQIEICLDERRSVSDRSPVFWLPGWSNGPEPKPAPKS